MVDLPSALQLSPDLLPAAFGPYNMTAYSIVSPSAQEIYQRLTAARSSPETFTLDYAESLLLINHITLLMASYYSVTRSHSATAPITPTTMDRPVASPNPFIAPLLAAIQPVAPGITVTTTPPPVHSTAPQGSPDSPSSQATVLPHVNATSIAAPDNALINILAQLSQPRPSKIVDVSSLPSLRLDYSEDDNDIELDQFADAVTKASTLNQWDTLYTLHVAFSRFAANSRVSLWYKSKPLQPAFISTFNSFSDLLSTLRKKFGNPFRRDLAYDQMLRLDVKNFKSSLDYWSNFHMLSNACVPHAYTDSSAIRHFINQVPRYMKDYFETLSSTYSDIHGVPAPWLSDLDLFESKLTNFLSTRSDPLRQITKTDSSKSSKSHTSSVQPTGPARSQPVGSSPATNSAPAQATQRYKDLNSRWSTLTANEKKELQTLRFDLRKDKTWRLANPPHKTCPHCPQEYHYKEECPHVLGRRSYFVEPQLTLEAMSEAALAHENSRDFISRSSHKAFAVPRVTKPSEQYDELRLNSTVFNDIMAHWHISPSVDLMASRANSQCSSFYSLNVNETTAPGCLGLDSLAVPWTSEAPYYVFPPSSLLDVVLNKVRVDRTPWLVLISPYHEGSTTFKRLLRLSVADPLILPAQPDLFIPPPYEGIPMNWSSPKMPIAAFYISGNVHNLKLAQANGFPHLIPLAPAKVYNTSRSSTETTPNTAPPLLQTFKSLSEALLAPWSAVSSQVIESSSKSVSDISRLPIHSPINGISTRPISHVPTIAKGLIDSLPASIVIDNGSGCSMLSSAFFGLGLSKDGISQLDRSLILHGIGGDEHANSSIVTTVTLLGSNTSRISFPCRFYIIDSQQPLVLLGNDVLEPLRWLSVSLEAPMQSFGQSLLFPDTFIPLVSHVSSTSDSFHTHLCQSLSVPDTLTSTELEYITTKYDINLLQIPATPADFETFLTQHLKINLRRSSLSVWLMIRIIRQYFQVFAYPGSELGLYNHGTFKITLTQPQPATVKPRRFSPSDSALIDETIAQWQKLDIIYPCQEHGVFPHEFVIVKRSNRKPRPAIDYVVTNSITVPDNHRMVTMFDALMFQRSRQLNYVSTCDLKSAFWQIPTDAASRKYFAVRQPSNDKVWIPTRMMFGPCNAPATLDRYYARGTCSSLLWRVLSIYADDCNCITESFFHHLDGSCSWFSLLREDGWKLSLEKSSFLDDTLTGLGFKQTSNGIGPDPAKLEAIKNLDTPKNLQELWLLWGVLIFYQSHIPQLMDKFRLFLCLLNSGISAYHERKKKKLAPTSVPDAALADQIYTHAKSHLNLPINQPLLVSDKTHPRIRIKDRYMKTFMRSISIQQTPEYVDLVNLAKDTLCNDSVLASPLNPHEYLLRLDVDTSYAATNVTLMQAQMDQTFRPLCYYSKACKDPQLTLWPTELELWGIVTGLSAVQEYLVGTFPFVLVTDHKAILWIQNYKGNNRRLLNSKFLLEEYLPRMVIVHIDGLSHTVPDALSRLPTLQNNADHLSLHHASSFLKNIVPVSSTFLEQLVEYNTHMWNTNVFDGLDWPLAIRAMKLFRQCSLDITLLPDKERSFLSRWLYSDHVLYYHVSNDHGYRVFVPSDLIIPLLVIQHDNNGHFGWQKLIPTISATFYFPKMVRFVKNYVHRCQSCQYTKNNIENRQGLLHPIQRHTGRWTHIAIDTVFIDGLSGALIIVCLHTSRIHLWFLETVNLDQATFIDIMLTRYYPLHGLPVEIWSDKATGFSKSFTVAVWEKLGIQPNFITTEHHQANPYAERHIGLCLAVLRRYCHLNFSTWKDFLPVCEFSINSLPKKSNESISLSRFEHDLGYQPIGISSVGQSEIRSSSADELLTSLREMDSIAHALLVDMQQIYAQAYDENRKFVQFKVGDQVLIHKKHAHKLLSKRLGPYTIEEALPYDTYKLKLNDTQRIYPYFHVSSLSAYQSALPNQPSLTRPPPVFEDHYEIDHIVSHRRSRGEPWYRIRWFGYGEEDDTYLPERDLVESAPDLLRDYKKKFSLFVAVRQFHTSFQSCSGDVGC